MTNDVLNFEDISIPTDDMPPMDEAPGVSELSCKTCGKPLEYGGRGRKPVYCDEHKKKGSTASAPRAVSKRADTTAREAAEVLNQINGLIGIGLLLAPEPYKMPATAAKLESVSDKFTEQAYTALLTSPNLAKAIARAGGVSGSAGLIIAYGMLGASIAPVAVEEWKSKRKDK